MDQRFISILKTASELPDDFAVSADSRLQEDIGIDSLKLIDIVLRLEGEFGVSLSEDALAQAKTVSDLWDAVAVTSH